MGEVGNVANGLFDGCSGFFLLTFILLIVSIILIALFGNKTDKDNKGEYNT